MSWEKYIEESICAIGSDDFVAAEDALKLALQFAKQNYARSDNRLALVLSLLGHTYFCNQDFARATLLLEQSLKLHLDCQLSDNPCLVMDLFCLGQIKASRGRQLEICRLYADVLEKLKATKTKSGDMVRAIEMFQSLLGKERALLSAGDRLALENPMAVALSSDSQSRLIGTTGSANQGAAGQLTEPVLSIPENDSQHESQPKDGVSDGPRVDDAPVPVAECPEPSPVALTQLWQQQLDTGRACLLAEDDERETLVRAYLNLESALRLARNVFAESDGRIIDTLKALADASARLRMFSQAEALYRNAIVLVQNSSTASGSSVWILRVHLALLYCDCDLFKASRAILDEEVQTDESLSEDLRRRILTAREQIRTFEMATDLINQAQSAEKEQDFEKAARLANNAMSQMKQSFPPNHGELSGMLRYRARVLKLLERQEQAVELSERATRIERALDLMAADWLKITDDLPRVEITSVAV